MTLNLDNRTKAEVHGDGTITITQYDIVTGVGKWIILTDDQLKRILTIN